MTTISMTAPGLTLDVFFQKITRAKKPVKIRDNKNTYVLLSDEEWRGMQETNSLKSIPGVWESIVEGMNAPDSEFVDADTVMREMKV